MGATEIVKALVSPAEKLIDSITAAIGKAFLPHHTKKMADVKAYEIEKIGSAIRNNCDMPIQYNSDQTLGIDISNYEELIKRTGLRVAFQEIQKQENIEAIVDNAYSMLEDSPPVCSDPVDTGWMMRFINSVEDINDSDLQILWAKILAGEIKKPNSCSLRTMDVLKNLSVNEAKLFQKYSSFVIENSIINNRDLLKKYDISYEDLLILQDCGLLTVDNAWTCESEIKDKKERIAFNNNYVLFAEKNTEKTNNNTVSYNIFPLTEAGKTISRIIIESPNNDYFLEFCRIIVNTNNEIRFSLHCIKTSIDETKDIDYEDEDILERMLELK